MNYLLLLRGINVGGKNKVPMAELRQLLEQLGYTKVTSYINSGNIILESDQSAKTIRHTVEQALPRHFTLDRDILHVHVLTAAELHQVISEAPKEFSRTPEAYYRDAIFLIDIAPADALKVFSPREGVDTIWPGSGVIYSQRLGELRTKSRLGKIVGTPEYLSMTIRSWKTVQKLAELIQQ